MTATRDLECQTCQGTGLQHGVGDDCPTCHGRGKSRWVPEAALREIVAEALWIDLWLQSTGGPPGISWSALRGEASPNRKYMLERVDRALVEMGGE